MNVMLAYTSNGMLIGDFEEQLNGTYTVENPAIVQPLDGNSVTVIPFLGYTTKNKITLQSADIQYNSELFEPLEEVTSLWKKTFGYPVIEVQSKKLIL